jgi:amidase
VERTPDYPRALAAASAARILPGIAVDVADVPHRDRLEHRDRLAADIGSLLGGRPLARARAVEWRLAARLNSIFESVDLLVLPVAPSLPFAAGRYQGRGFVKTWLASGTLFAFTLPWNYTGQPAAAVPSGFTEDGRRH